MLIVGRGRFKRGIMYMVLTSCIIVLFLCLQQAGLKRYVLATCCKIALNTFCPAEFYEKPLYYYDTDTQPAVIVFGNIFPIVRFLAKADTTAGDVDVYVPTAGDSLYMEFCTEGDGNVEEDESTENTEGESQSAESENIATNDVTESNPEENGELPDADSQSSSVSAVPLATGTVPYEYEALADYNFVHDSFYVIPSHTALLNNILKPDEFLKNNLSVNGKTPCILIYHTHSQEAFADSTGDNMTIVQVGDYLE